MSSGLIQSRYSVSFTVCHAYWLCTFGTKLDWTVTGSSARCALQLLSMHYKCCSESDAEWVFWSHPLRCSVDCMPASCCSWCRYSPTVMWTASETENWWWSNCGLCCPNYTILWRLRGYKHYATGALEISSVFMMMALSKYWYRDAGCRLAL